MTDERIRVLVVDDHAVVREGIRHVLVREAGFEVVAEAGDGPEAITLARIDRCLELQGTGDEGRGTRGQA